MSHWLAIGNLQTGVFDGSSTENGCGPENGVAPQKIPSGYLT